MKYRYEQLGKNYSIYPDRYQTTEISIERWSYFKSEYYYRFIME
jgi:hypothetical protein